MLDPNGSGREAPGGTHIVLSPKTEAVVIRPGRW